MGIRDPSLEATGAMFATFSIGQTPEGIDKLKDADIGKAVRLTGNNQVGPTMDRSVVLGKLVDLTLTDKDNGKRVATIQIAGIVPLPLADGPAYAVPQVNEQVVGADRGYVCRPPCLLSTARGTVISVNGKTECTLIL